MRLPNIRDMYVNFCILLCTELYKVKNALMPDITLTHFTLAQTDKTGELLHRLSKKDENRYYVQKLLYYKDLITEHYNSWHPPDRIEN